MPGQRFGDVILRVGDLDLAQVAAERAHHGDVAPAEAGFEHEAVEAVRFREAAEEREQGRLDQRLDLVDLDDAARRALQGHVVQPDPVGVR